MATSGGQPGSSLSLALLQKSHEFDFFQAVRLCLRLNPERLEPGGFGLPSQEAVRFYQLNSFSFPPAVIDRIDELSRYQRRSSSPVPFHMTVTVLGLTGYAGLLPWFYTRLLIEGNPEKKTDSRPDQAFAEFLDLFNHRMVSLQYRAWEKHRPHVPYERRSLPRRSRSSLADYLLALLGLSEPSVRERLQVPDPVLLGHLGILSAIPRSAAGLKHLIRSHFGLLAVDVLEFQGRWCGLRPSERSVLGGGGDQSRLGTGAVLGRGIWYPQASFRIRVGRLSFKDFLSFGPGQKRFGELIDLVEFFTRGVYQEFEVELLLSGDQVPSSRFMKPRFKSAPRLGWVGWLGEDRRKKRQTRKNQAPKSVVFRSSDPRALLRQQVDRALKGLQSDLRRERNLELEWSDGVVKTYGEQFMQLCGDPLAPRERVRSVLALLINSRIQFALDRLQQTTDWSGGKVLLTADLR